jgi:transposase
VALEALRGDKTVQEIAAKRQLHPTQVSTWKRQAIEGMVDDYSKHCDSTNAVNIIAMLHENLVLSYGLQIVGNCWGQKSLSL